MPYFLLFTFLFISGASAADYTILKIGDKEVKKSEVETVWESLFPSKQAPDFETFDEQVRQNVLRGIISEQLLYEKAKKQGLHESTEVQAQLEAIRRKIAVQAFMQEKISKTISEKQIKKAYDVLVKKLRDEKEMQARHILVKDESDAKKIKKQLDEGADFETLAKETSIDKGSARVGGDLGWFTRDKMVPAFAKAAFALKEGDVSPPVKSQFGWHLIKAGQKRTVEVPAYDDLKEQLRTELQERALDDYIEDLIDQTDISYFDADGKKLDFTKVPDSTKQ